LFEQLERGSLLGIGLFGSAGSIIGLYIKQYLNTQILTKEFAIFLFLMAAAIAFDRII
jgi:uncharacterized membrane protein YfcA